jgi:hypothetical protein
MAEAIWTRRVLMLTPRSAAISAGSRPWATRETISASAGEKLNIIRARSDAWVEDRPTSRTVIRAQRKLLSSVVKGSISSTKRLLAARAVDQHGARSPLANRRGDPAAKALGLEVVLGVQQAALLAQAVAMLDVAPGQVVGGVDAALAVGDNHAEVHQVEDGVGHVRLEDAALNF